MGNNFSNITNSGTGILTGWSQLDAGLTTKIISNNTFTNWTNLTGAITAMTVTGFGNTSAVAGNTISTITGQAAITGITIGTAGNATALNVNGNTISGLSSTGTGGAVTALASVNNSTAVNIFSDSINNLSSTGASVTVAGISITGGTGTVSLYSNILSNIRGTGVTSPIAQGLAVSGGATVNIYRNKVYDIAENGISTGATVNGFNITGGTNVTCYNNIIGDLKAPNVSSASAVRGIFINSAALNSSYRLYYNSVYLNATSTGANFGSYGLYHNTTTTATTANLILNNNVIVNVSTASGTGFTTAFFLSSTALANYDLSSNNNLFYAGVPGTKNVLLSVSTTNYSTLNDLQGFVLPREVGSVTENVTFISTTASSTHFLKPDSTLASAIESGGVNISGITDDYAGSIRQGNAGTTSTGTAPDIGAFEQNGTAITYPVVVTGALVGNGNYGTLGSALNAINSGAQTGANITVSIQNNTDELTSTAVLNAGAWASLTITPNGARTVTGATTAGNPLINLNGADNVTINGLNTGGNSLTIINTTLSASAGTSTIRFINDATNNTIT
ncbi:MAG: beta strand repeat-containing protein, partial [Bacteroidota bacterium]